MNSIVETINAAGRGFTAFALPMLIQSSLLILLLLAADAILRKRVRAVFRYWIWMLVLVKLVLPPSLGSPVSIGTWFGDKLELAEIAPLESQEPQPAELSPVVRNILSRPEPMSAEPPVPQPTTPPPVQGPPGVDAVARAVPISQPPATPLTWQGLTLLVWAVTVMALMLLLVQRAFFVQGLAAQAEEANEAMLDELERCRRQIGLRGQITLRLSPNATSPAVCGLVHPVILIPQNLASRLQGSDLQAVLLHELAHVKRGDLWINLAQTLLQIVYFYNPLLWLANTAMRRVREQAVDETVLVAMGETARQYPETLVNVAKLAFRKRPTLSLRLIGVVESRSALTGRISHILNRPIPRTARLGAASVAAIIMAACVLLPMAKGESSASTVTASQEPPAGASQGLSAETNPVRPETAEKRRTYLPDLETPGKNTVLDLGTGELLPGEPMGRDPLHFDKLGKGDIAYEYVNGKSGLLCFRGARILTASTPQFGAPQTKDISQPDVQRPGFVAYFIEASRRYLLQTADGKKYELTVISIDKGDSGGALVEWGVHSSAPGSSKAPASDGISGQVLDSNGRPVARAQLGLNTELHVLLHNGVLQLAGSGTEGKWLVVTDADGRFHFEGKVSDPFYMLVAHEAGFALVVGNQFPRNGEIRLERWGRIEGQLARGRAGLGHRILMKRLPKPRSDWQRSAFCYDASYGADGRFVFERVPPGWFEVGYLVPIGDDCGGLTSRTPVLVKAGDTIQVKVGGEGRPVIGRFVAPPSYGQAVYFGGGLRALRGQERIEGPQYTDSEWFRRHPVGDPYSEMEDFFDLRTPDYAVLIDDIAGGGG